MTWGDLQRCVLDAQTRFGVSFDDAEIVFTQDDDDFDDVVSAKCELTGFTHIALRIEPTCPI